MPDLRTADVLRSTGTLAIVEGILFIVGGIMLVVAPFPSVVTLTQITGVLLLLGGVVGVRIWVQSLPSYSQVSFDAAALMPPNSTHLLREMS